MILPHGSGGGGALPERGQLHVALQPIASSRWIRQLLREYLGELAEPFPGVLVAPATTRQLAAFCNACRAQIAPADCGATRCLFAPADRDPTPAEWMQSRSLAHLMARVEGQWLARLLDEDRLLVHFQPIVRVDAPQQPFAYECLLRGDDEGQTVFPDRLFAAARGTGLLHRLDEAARLKAIQTAARQGVESLVFINFSPRSIEHPQQCLESTVWTAAASGLPPDRFVFEVVESDEIVEFDKLVEMLDYLRAAGCRVALDDLGAGNSSLKLLARLRPDFVKLDMELIRNVDRDAFKSCVASKVLELARELGVATVVEGVETAGEFEWAAAHGACFAQGYLIARPAPVPPRGPFLQRGAAREEGLLELAEAECCAD